MQLVDDHVDDSTANNTDDTPSENMESSNYESPDKANGPSVSHSQINFERLFAELQITMFMTEPEQFDGIVD